MAEFAQIELSIVVPALNEADNMRPLAEQVHAAMAQAGISAELIVVDDGSTDDTLQNLEQLQQQYLWLVILHRKQPQGQSAAIHAGVQAARGQWVAMLDADLQNDPADLPHLLTHAKAGSFDLVQGIRRNRRDTAIRKCSTWVGLTTRKIIFGDTIIDTGCATRVLKTEFARQIPLYFHGMHRFVAQYAVMLGAKVDQLPVNHRSRKAGVSKYGIWNRAWVGLFDCLAIRWMHKRYRNPAIIERNGEK